MGFFLKKHWLSEIVLLLAGVIATFLLNWRSPAMSQTGARRVKGYGGRLPSAAAAALIQMQRDLESSIRLLETGSDRVVFLDRAGNRRMYQYLFETLWRDDFPVLTDVLAFHFEFRDGHGNAALPGSEHMASIESAGYTLRIAHGANQILAHAKVPVRFRRAVAMR